MYRITTLLRDTMTRRSVTRRSATPSLRDSRLDAPRLDAPRLVAPATRRSATRYGPPPLRLKKNQAKVKNDESQVTNLIQKQKSRPRSANEKDRGKAHGVREKLPTEGLQA